MTDSPFSESDDAGKIRFVASRTAGDVFSTALRFVGAEARTLGPAVLAIAGPLVLAAALLRAIGGTTGGDTLASIADIGVNVVLTSAILAYVRLYRDGALHDGTEIADVWDETKAYLGPVAVAGGAALIALIALVIPLAILVGALFVVNEVLAAVVGIALLLIGMAIAAPLVVMTVIAVGLDGLGPAEALRRVSDLAQRERGLVLGTLALLVVSTVIVLTFAIGGLAAGLGLDRLAEPGPWTALATAIVSFATLPVNVTFTVAWILLYGSLVARAEGGALADEIDAIAGEPDARLDAAPVTEARTAEERPADALARKLEEPTDRFRGGGFDDAAADDSEARP